MLSQSLLRATRLPLCRFIGVAGQVFPQADIAIIGAGAAGTAAAVAARYEGHSVYVFERRGRNGFFASTPDIHNIPGFPHGVSGHNYAVALKEQLHQLGASVFHKQLVNISEFDASAPGRRVLLDADYNQYSASAIIVATGVNYRELDVEGATTAARAGRLHYEATNEIIDTDMTNKTIAIYGAGNSGGQAAVFYRSFGARTLLMYRGAQVGESMSAYLTQRLQSNGVHQMARTQVLGVELLEDRRLRLRLLRTPFAHLKPDVREVVVDYLFVMIGGVPSPLPAELASLCDARGHIVVDDRMATAAKGVFAAGDITHQGAGRIVLAQAQGVIAFQSAARFLAQHAK